jgi:putative peptidoglycan lipid II flippase
VNISAASPAPSRRFTHVARSSLLIAVFFGLDKLLGLVRQVVVGRQFGVGAELDVFNAANNLPDLLFALISGGALAVAFIPVLSQAMELDGRDALWAVFSRIANLAFVVTGGLALALALSADHIVGAQWGVAPGFSPENQALVVRLMRLDLIATLIFSLSGLVSAGLQANQHFLLPALAPAMYDVGQIFGAVVLAPAQGYHLAGLALPAAGLGIFGLVFGVILGAALHLGIQIPGLMRYRFRWTPRLNLDHPGVHTVLRLMGPRILSIGAFNLIFVVQDNLASRLDVGSVTALAYGWLIMQVPETIIGTAVGIAILPTLSEHFARADWARFEASVARAFRVLLALTVPAAILLMIGIRPLVQAAFHFDPRGTELVTWAARAYLLGLVGHSLLEVASRAFYARQDARTPLLASVISLTTFVITSLILYRGLGAMGIALSNSLAFSLEAGLLIYFLSRRFPAVLRQGRTLLRLTAGCGLAGALAFVLMPRLPMSDLLAAAAALGLAGALAAAFIRPELRELARL